jgi:hypothetical protein
VSQKTGWEKDAALFEDVAQRALTLHEAYMQCATAQAIRSCRLTLRTVVKKSEV